MKYKCSACGHIYNEAEEDVKFADLKEDWVCPKCGAPKEAFELEENSDEDYYGEDIESESDEDLI
ncbi:MAG TPA: rubredoxin [Candidatus Paceibacterota bacterium]|nr:rubredoxin [Candidatus Paceibacterota bacterium]